MSPCQIEVGHGKFVVEARELASSLGTLRPKFPSDECFSGMQTLCPGMARLKVSITPVNPPQVLEYILWYGLSAHGTGFDGAGSSGKTLDTEGVTAW